MLRSEHLIFVPSLRISCLRHFGFPFARGTNSGRSRFFGMRVQEENCNLVLLAGVTLVRDAQGGLVKGLPYRLDGKGIAIERAAPDLGQHTDAVLRELLGYGDAELSALKKSGVTSTTPTVGDV